MVYQFASCNKKPLLSASDIIIVSSIMGQRRYGKTKEQSKNEIVMTKTQQ